MCAEAGCLSAISQALGSDGVSGARGICRRLVVLQSSLLQAVLGELATTSGELAVRGKVSYACQEPWLFAASIRQNITFGSQFDRRRYDAVVKACALLADFSQLPFGDLTLVGERGSSLSGGQRARVNLARWAH